MSNTLHFHVPVRPQDVDQDVLLCTWSASSSVNVCVCVCEFKDIVSVQVQPEVRANKSHEKPDILCVSIRQKV